MQTLTRLLSRLWEAVFPKAQRRAQRAGGLRREDRLPTWAAGPQSRRRSLCDPPTRPTGYAKPKTFADPDDIAFCAWMYYLN